MTIVAVAVVLALIAGGVFALWRNHEEQKAERRLRDRARERQRFEAAMRVTDSYPPRKAGQHSTPWKNTQPAREGGCGTVTTMGRALSETYARDPKFYGATFCVGCNKHFPVAEFVWTADDQVVGS